MIDLTLSQRRFLHLHVKDVVDKWQWHFRGTQLRAHVRRRRATICAAELDDLVSKGLMGRGAGAADVYVTSAGKALF